MLADSRAAQPPALTSPAQFAEFTKKMQAADRLRQGYLRGGDVAALDKTLDKALEASKADAGSAPAGDPVARGLALSVRSALLRAAYQRDKDPAGLAAAIDAGRTAKGLFKPNDPAFPKALNTLGNVLQEEYERTSDPAILTEALGMYRDAVSALPAGHPEIPGMMSNIGNVLITQGLAERSPRLLAEAIQAGREAVGASVPDGPAFASRLASLGMALVAHYANCSGPAAELDEAERLFNEALTTLPPAHTLRGQVQGYLTGVATLRRNSAR